ncbi:thiol-disulfide isomerase [Marinigracilibium pacificum]|uniref:Thiol-disulfide isomerase n=1 Tax=Marinigracilibium pacificum TaxID=2729599 RepID=A0A848IWW3_9BACT|nr:thiol-disulfide isomerase [Marinigracilibium pacificum]NMM47658.1 thiol-disulfide isomerase [Marinigracilibium pacificum]
MPALEAVELESDPKNDLSIIYFSGSDWCADCIVIKRDILDNPVFETFLSRNNINMEIIDFPQRKKLPKETKQYNSEIADKYAFDGAFPTMLLVNESTGKVIKLIPLGKSVEEFTSEISSHLKVLQ